MRHSTLTAAVVLAVAALVITPLTLVAGEEHGHDKMMSKEVTLEGEVLDLYCFMNHPDTGQGADHAKCAAKCIAKGLPIGFMSNGDVYLIVGKEHESAADMCADLAGRPSRIKGTLITHHGMKAIELTSIEKL